jgi:hypothetical protein
MSAVSAGCDDATVICTEALPRQERENEAIRHPHD